jgi:ribosomal protein S18 acetylase RimI-like enzyme
MPTIDRSREARIETLEPRSNSWLRWAVTRPETRFFETEGGLLAIHGTTAKLSIPATEDAARTLARASNGIPISWMIGAPEAVRAFVEARDDGAGFCLEGATIEMAFLGDRSPAPSRKVPGEVTTVAALSGSPPDEKALPAPFDAWMKDFSQDRFPDAGAPPPVRPGELWVWLLDGEPCAMAGALSARPSDLRIVTVWTPPDARGKGYAGALVRTIGENAERRGIANITLNVQDDNTPAVRAYVRAGFHPIAQTENWIQRL